MPNSAEQITQITRLLSRLSSGDIEAADQVMPLLYADLHARAAAMMRREQSHATLQPTALLNEAWMRLQGNSGSDYADRAHFLRLAGRIMRNVLVDHARRRKRSKRQGGSEELAVAIGPETTQQVEVLDLQAALEKLANTDPELEQVVELRYFAGLTLRETAETLGKTTSSVHRAWELARAFLLRELSTGGT